MPSHLTRVVFRSIIAETPLIYRGCTHRAPRLRTSFQYGTRSMVPQRRTFFGMFKAPRKLKPIELTPGFEVIATLARRLGNGERPPTPKAVAEAFSLFISQRALELEDFHVSKLLSAFQYLLEHPKEDDQPWITYPEMRRLMYTLEHFPPQTGGKPHVALAKRLDAEMEKVIEKEDEMKGLKALTLYEGLQLPKLIRVLCVYGASLEAREMVVVKTYGASWDSYSEQEKKMLLNIWKAVVQGFAREGNTSEMVKTVDIMNEASVMFKFDIHGILVEHFVAKNDLEQAKHWYTKKAPDDSSRVVPALAPLLVACANAGDLSFGHQLVASLLQTMPDKKTCDAIYLWSAAIGKGPDEIDRMMDVMERRNPDPRPRPDINTINSLVAFAMSKQDSYLAERFVVLGERRGIFPNESTYILQIRYRLSINDIDGARTAYFGLQGQTSHDGEYVEVANELIRALCKVQKHHFDDIMAIVDDLHEQKARLAPETVAMLCVLHLQRGELHDAGDILNLHAFHFSPEQRLVIRKSLASFIMDGQTSTEDAWQTYQMLRSAFPETPRVDRIPIMNEFFARKRSDMACHVFFHMRNSVVDNIAADRDVYVAAFTGFARNADAESLELAHNQLKIDSNVEMDTKLRNSLMLAYAAVGEHRRAMQFWAEIGSSEEGPTYNSIVIAFRACEGTHYGERHARSIWQRLKEMDVDIDKQIWIAYMCAIARNHLHEEARALVENVEEEYGFPLDFEILGNWFQCTVRIEDQGKVEAWIKERYPEVWTQLEALGQYRTMEGFGYRQFNFNRDIDP